jgi:hypothetical protein
VRDEAAATPPSWPRVVSAVGVAAFVIIWLLLSVYPIEALDQPRGYDTPRYLWRTSCVEAFGVRGLASCAGGRQAGLPSRAGYPIVSLVTSGVLRQSRTTMAAIVPVVAAAAIAMAAAALVAWALELSIGGFLVVALVVGFSPLVIAMATPEGYADAMLGMAVALAGVVVLGTGLLRSRGLIAASVLLGTAAVVHWPTAAVVGAALGLAAVIALVRGRADESGRGVAARVALPLGGAAVVWGLGLAAIARTGPDTFRIPRGVFEDKLRSHVARLGLPVALPAAAIGLWTLVRRPSRAPLRRWFLAAVLCSWVVVIAAALVAWFLGRSLPIHRFVLMLLPLPILGAVALLWLGSLAGRRSPVASRVITVAGVIVVVGVGFVLWDRSPKPVIRTDRVASAQAAGDYLASSLPRGTRITVVADEPSTVLDILRQTFRSAIPPEWISSIRFRRFAEPSAGSVTLAVRGHTNGFDDMAVAHPDRLAAPDVLVLRGPLPAMPIAGRDVDTVTTNLLELVGLGLAAFAILGIVGGGWAWSATPGAPSALTAAALAPSVGIAVLVLAGGTADAIGIRLVGWSTPLVAGGAALAGWAFAALLWWRSPIPRIGSRTIPSC